MHATQLTPKSFLSQLKLLLTTSMLVLTSFSVHAQTSVAPNQCIATPTFPKGSVELHCAEGLVPADKPLYVEDLNSGFGDFTEDAPPAGTVNDLTNSTNGDTPSAGTGPETTASCNGPTNDGEFVFLEGSTTLPNETHCMTNAIDLSDAVAPLQLSFWYYMFGDNIGKLSVELNDVEQFSLSNQQQTQNGQAWQQGKINLNAHAGSIVNVKVCMAEGNGAQSTFESDLSVDQFEVYGCEPVRDSCFVVKGENGKTMSFCL